MFLFCGLKFKPLTQICWSQKMLRADPHSQWILTYLSLYFFFTLSMSIWHLREKLRHLSTSVVITWMSSLSMMPVVRTSIRLKICFDMTENNATMNKWTLWLYVFKHHIPMRVSAYIFPPHTYIYQHILEFVLAG